MKIIPSLASCFLAPVAILIAADTLPLERVKG